MSLSIDTRVAHHAILALLLLAPSAAAQGVQGPTLLRAQSAPAFASKQVKSWIVPFGAWAGEVAVEPNGTVWFCQPTLVSLTRFDPQTEVFTLHNPGFIGPHGVTIDAAGGLWATLKTGAGGGKLDEFDPVTETDVHHSLPYAGALPTRVMISSTGTVWVLDSLKGQASEFEPSTGTWLQSRSVPIAGAFPTSFAEDPATQTIYATCYQVDKLVIFAPGQPAILVPTPGIHPISCTWSGGLLYYVLASQPKLLTYDPATGLHKAYTYGAAWDPAATVLALPDGRLAVGTSNGHGNLHLFQPATHSFTTFEFPPGLKGDIGSRMTLGPGGKLWLTKVPSSGPSLLVRMHLPQ